MIANYRNLMRYKICLAKSKDIRYISSAFSKDGVVVHSLKSQPLLKSPDINVPLGKFVLSNYVKNKSEWANNIVLVDGSTNQSLTFNEAYELSYRVVSSIRRTLGEKPKGGVALISPNHINWMPVFTAITLSGSYCISINPMGSSDDITAQLTLPDAQLVFCHPSLLSSISKITKSLKIPIVSMENSDDPDIPSFDDFIKSEIFSDIDIESFPSSTEKFDSSSIAVIPFSSGTTGNSKGVMLTHKNIISNIIQGYDFEGKYMVPGPNNPNPVCLTPLPFYHIFGMSVGVCGPYYYGGKCVFMPSFDLQKYLALISQHKVIRTHVVPPIVIALAKHPLVDQYDLSSLKCVFSGAAPLGADIQELCANRLKCCVKQGWGLTELSPMGTVCEDGTVESVSKIKGKAGFIAPDSEAKIVDAVSGVDLPYSQEGEILIRGPQVMAGYLKNPEATKQCLRPDGWLHTGDVGFFDEDGCLHVTDRSKELIKYKGFQVPPAELEALIISIPQVKDVVVIPVQDEEAGEIPRAYVVKQDNCPTDFTEKDIIDFIAKRVAPQKRLRGGVVFTDAIPKSPSGKLLRRVQVEFDRAKYPNGKLDT